MTCLYCGGVTRVFNSRLQKRRNKVWRRRRCLKCGAVFSSIESAELSKSVVLNTKTGYKPFSRDILFVSLYDSLRHRKTALNDATALTDTVISRLSTSKSPAVDAEVLKQLVCTVLKNFDKAALVHYQAYYVK